MFDARVEKIFIIFEITTRGMTPPMVELIVREFGRKPFIILIACLISLRSRDRVTYHVCRELFSLAQTPQEILKLPIDQLDGILSKVNYHFRKAKTLHSVS